MSDSTSATLDADSKWFPGVPSFDDLHNADSTYHVAGRNPLAGTYKGKAGLYRLQARVARIAREAPGFEIDWATHDTLEDDRHGVVIGNLRLALNGKRLESRVVIVLDYQGTKVRDIWLHVDKQNRLDKLLQP